MAFKKKGMRVAESGEINMTPMIDIVFQMIIFFVLTVELEKDMIDEHLKLAMSPHGPAIEQKDPRTIHVDVRQNGRLSLGRVPVSDGQLRNILRNAAMQYGATTPVVIRGDMNTPHEEIKRVMDICTSAGIWKIKFGAIKEKVK